MPHVIVKLYSGRSEQQKEKLAAEVTKAVMAAPKTGEESGFGGDRRCRAERLGGEGLQAGYSGEAKDDL